MQHQGEKMLLIGQTAPIFQTQDIFENPVTVGIGKHWTLLSFLRNGACAICNLRIHELISKYPELQELGLEIIAVFESPVDSIRVNVTKQNAAFTLLSDPEAKLYDLYQVETSQEKVALTMQMPETQVVIAQAARIGYPLTPEEGSNFYRIPADFLIDPNGKLQLVHYANHLTDHLSFEAICAALT
jgi:thioredoxin-dependent peroxiredoxin